jgi:hypothetical protein
MKRSLEEVFGANAITGDVLGDVTFKYRSHLDMAKSGFVPSQCGQSYGLGTCRDMDYQAYLNMEECALLAEAHAIEKRRDEPPAQHPIELRDIKRVKRRPQPSIQQTRLVDQQDVPVLDPALQSVELEDPALEKVEIEYLEKLASDCKLPVTREKAFVMKKYTDMLLNAVTRDKAAELKRVKAENIILKRAFKLQNEVADKAKAGASTLQAENDKLRQGLEQTLQENRLLVSKLRELLMQDMSGQCGPTRPSFGWGDDIAGF